MSNDTVCSTMPKIKTFKAQPEVEFPPWRPASVLLVILNPYSLQHILLLLEDLTIEHP